MKTLSKFGMLLTLAASMFLASCAGSYYVAERPVEPAYERPMAPYAGAIWIDGEWGWSGGRYVYMRGHWARPRAGHVYTRGSWERRDRGYIWHRGHWDR